MIEVNDHSVAFATQETVAALIEVRGSLLRADWGCYLASKLNADLLLRPRPLQKSSSDEITLTFQKVSEVHLWQYVTVRLGFYDCTGQLNPNFD